MELSTILARSIPKLTWNPNYTSLCFFPGRILMSPDAEPAHIRSEARQMAPNLCSLQIRSSSVRNALRHFCFQESVLAVLYISEEKEICVWSSQSESCISRYISGPVAFQSPPLSRFVNRVVSSIFTASSPLARYITCSSPGDIGHVR